MNLLRLVEWCWLGTFKCVPLNVSNLIILNSNFGILVWFIGKNSCIWTYYYCYVIHYFANSIYSGTMTLLWSGILTNWYSWLKILCITLKLYKMTINKIYKEIKYGNIYHPIVTKNMHESYYTNQLILHSTIAWHIYIEFTCAFWLLKLFFLVCF